MERHEIEQAVQEIPLFSRLGKEQQKRISEHAIVNRIPNRAVFHSEATAAQGLHVLLKGKVKLFRISDDGKEQTIFIFGPGEPFCLCSVFSDGTMPANMGALEDSTVLFISPAEFEKLVHEDPAILLNMMKVMSRRLKEAVEMIDSLALKQVPSRLAAYFLSREKYGTVHMDISYRELSKIIGATPEALSRVMKKMQEHGLITVDGKIVTIPDRKQLALCGDGSCS